MRLNTERTFILQNWLRWLQYTRNARQCSTCTTQARDSDGTNSPCCNVESTGRTPCASQTARGLGYAAGGFDILAAKGIVDELIYSELGNEVLLIKHTAYENN